MGFIIYFIVENRKEIRVIVPFSSNEHIKFNLFERQILHIVKGSRWTKHKLTASMTRPQRQGASMEFDVMIIETNLMISRLITGTMIKVYLVNAVK